MAEEEDDNVAVDVSLASQLWAPKTTPHFSYFP